MTTKRHHDVLATDNAVVQVLGPTCPREPLVERPSVAIAHSVRAPRDEDAYEGPRTIAAVRPSAGPLAHATRYVLEAFEAVSKFVSFNRYEGETHDIAVGRERLSFRVDAQVGQGVFGVVHHVTLDDAPRGLEGLYEVGGQRRSDLVVKFPNRVPLPLPALLNPWVRNINAEIKDERRFLAALLPGETIAGPRILYARTGRRPFIVKPFETGDDLRTVGCRRKTLDETQRAALQSLFETARSLHARTGTAVDLKAENVVWNPAAKSMGLYEISAIPALVSGFFTARGFDAYVDYVEAHMRSGPDRRRLEDTCTA